METQSTSSTLKSLLSLSEANQEKVLQSLTDEECASLLYDWEVWARPSQLPPTGDWRVWLVMAGRGYGKTRLGAEDARHRVETGKCGRLALIAPTAADARDTMVEGESGILSVCPPWNRPKYEPSKRRLTWPNGAMATLFSADEPDRLRGPSHDYVWADELAAWRYPEAWDMAMFGLRLGADPRAVVTTTPKPVKVLRELLELPSTVVTKGTTYENRANLAEAFFEKIIRKYEGTRLGKQELEAQLLEDYPGALWSREMIIRATNPPDFTRIVVAMDPAVSSGDDAAEMGIVVCARGDDDRGYVLEDVSQRTSPKVAAEVAVSAYHKWKADRIVAEVNNGGEWIEAVLRTVDQSIAYKCLHASRGKVTRAEPIAALYEQGRVSHVGMFDDLEDQMCMYVPGEPSPDRMDALVWGMTELALENYVSVEGVQSGSVYERDDPGY